MIVGLSVGMVRASNQMEELISKIDDSSARKVDLGNAVNVRFGEMLAAQRAVYLGASLRDRNRVEDAKRRFEESAQEASRALDGITPPLISGEAKKLVGDLRTKLRFLRNEFPTVYQHCVAGRPEMAFSHASGNMIAVYDAAGAVVDDLIALVARQMAGDKAEAQETSSMYKILAWCLALLGLVAGVTVTRVERSISLVLRELASRMADGAAQVAS